MAKLTGKQQRRWGAVQNMLYENRPLALKEIFEAETRCPEDDISPYELIDTDTSWMIDEIDDDS